MAILIPMADADKDYATLACEKIDAEAKEFNGDRYGKAVYEPVAEKIKGFCKEDSRFAEVVFKTKRNLSDCVKEIMKGCGNYISDLDVYKKAAQFYFPNLKVKGYMEIEIVGENPDDEYLNKEAPKEPVKKKNNKKELSGANKMIAEGLSPIIKELAVNRNKELEEEVKKRTKKEKPESIQLTLF